MAEKAQTAFSAPVCTRLGYEHPNQCVLSIDEFAKDLCRELNRQNKSAVKWKCGGSAGINAGRESVDATRKDKPMVLAGFCALMADKYARANGSPLQFWPSFPLVCCRDTSARNATHEPHLTPTAKMPASRKGAASG